MLISMDKLVGILNSGEKSLFFFSKLKFDSLFFFFSIMVLLDNKVMSNFPRLLKKSLIYEDQNLYACLAKFPVTKGHTVVVWRKEFSDLKLLSDRDYDYLMDTVFAVRNALLKTLKVKKVYLIYMDEANYVHWHLVPRYKEKGFDLFRHKPRILNDFSLAKKIKKNLVFE